MLYLSTPLEYDPSLNSRLAAQQALRILNDLYEFHVLPAFGLAHTFSRPHGGAPVLLPTDFMEVQATLSAKRKLARIPTSKPIVNIPLSIGDLVDVYVRLEG